MSGNKHLGASNTDLERKKAQKLVEKLKKQLESSTDTLAIMQKIAKEQQLGQSSQNNSNPTSITNKPVLNSDKKNTTEDKSSVQPSEESKNNQKLR